MLSVKSGPMRVNIKSALFLLTDFSIQTIVPVQCGQLDNPPRLPKSLPRLLLANPEL
jgi:hypothetical protein